jgi:hypothetical protein
LVGGDAGEHLAVAIKHLATRRCRSQLACQALSARQRGQVPPEPSEPLLSPVRKQHPRRRVPVQTMIASGAVANKHEWPLGTLTRPSKEAAHAGDDALDVLLRHFEVQGQREDLSEQLLRDR